MTNFDGFLGQFMGFVQNPVQFLAQRRLNLPQNAFENPKATVQQLMNSGQLSQQQFNQLQQMATQIQNNPQFQQMFKK